MLPFTLLRRLECMLDATSQTCWQNTKQ
ncbi:hypothetical protein [Pectobacterium peruviense]|nr:hypothetical protein [Pectobacterium peruviense]